MVLLTAADRRSPFPPPITPARFVQPGPDPSPLSVTPRDLHLTYARTELCHDCGKVLALRSVYPLEFRHHLISGLMPCWARGQAFFKLKSALGYAQSVVRNLSRDAVGAVRHHETSTTRVTTTLPRAALLKAAPSHKAIEA